MRIGIITLYYRSVNYGGNLQAYALWHVLNRMGYDVEQICIDLSGLDPHSKVWKLLKSIIRSPKTLLELYQIAPYRKQLKQRIQSIRAFNDSIPHSEDVYTISNISKCVNRYDAFIAGSDMVWQTFQLPYENNPFFLTFAPKSKLKMSYAASLANVELNEAQQNYIKKALSTYRGVSVRENSSIKLLSNLSPVEVRWVLDPVLLLSNLEWDMLCNTQSLNGKYIFCYFLGGVDLSCHELVTSFARKHNLRIKTMPFLPNHNHYNENDVNFGDEKIWDCTPTQFVDLIKNSAYIFTDSFHATAFSCLYHKQFFIINTARSKGASERLYSICKIFNTEERFCDTPEKISLEYIQSLKEINFDDHTLDKTRTQSIDFLKKH